MNNTIMVHAGRQFLPEEIDLIKWTGRHYKDLNRREFAKTVCEFLNWKTNSGKVKTSLCLEFLQILEQNSIIKLPPAPKPVVQKKPSTKSERYDGSHLPKDELLGSVGEYPSIQLEVVHAGTEELKRWRYYLFQPRFFYDFL